MLRICSLTAVLAVLALGVAACGGGEETEPTAEPGGQTTETAPPATETEPPASETAPPPETITLSVYFMRGEKVGVAHRQVVKQETVGTAAIEELLGGPAPEEEAAGLHSEIPEGTVLNSLNIENGIATVDLSSEFDDGGGSLTMFARLAQVVYTLTQFPTVEGVRFELDGEPVDVFSGEGIVLEEPQTREDYEDLTPAILVETPAVGDTISSPMELAGTANTFEATLNYELLGADGEVLAGNFLTATCGTGCRGTFEASVPFEWMGEPRGTLVAFEISAKDGSRINVVEIPLAFE
jgi:spore germination protein GerM